jgi:NAD(P)-dependent dehydrogenase (short-subunit alcohol dehydrogenase family)
MNRITTPFDRRTTAADIAQGIDLCGKQVVVTGAASGIGLETARTLALCGAEVTLAVRAIEPAKAIAAELIRVTNNPRIHVSPLDLASRQSVGEFVRRWEGPLHILVNNADVMALPRLERTIDGWEMQFAHELSRPF